MNIDPTWTPASRESAAKCGLSLTQAVDIIYNRRSIAIVIGAEPDSIWFIGGQNLDEYFAVLCDHQSANTTIYEITLIRPASTHEIQMWRSRPL